MYRCAKFPTHTLDYVTLIHQTPYKPTLHQDHDTQPVLHICTGGNYRLTVISFMTTWQNKHFLSLTFPLKSTDVTQAGVKYFVWEKVLTIVRGDEWRPGHLRLRQQQQQQQHRRTDGHCSGQTRAQTARCNDVMCQKLRITVRHCKAQLRPACRQDVPDNQFVDVCDWFSALAIHIGAHENTLSGFLNSVAWEDLKIYNTVLLIFYAPCFKFF